MRRGNQAHAFIMKRQCQQLAVAASMLLALNGCVDLQALRLPHPSVTPEKQPTASLDVDASHVEPMYHRLLAIDLPTVARVALARNLDIQQAQQRVEASRGAYEASIGAFFPSITPSVTALGLRGAVSSGGVLGNASFANFLPAAALQWIINPGQVAYDLIASRRQLEGSAQKEQAVEQETTRLAAVQYYTVVLTQAQLAATRQALDEAQELLRIERLRLQTGNGLPADELRAEAAFAAAQEAELTALNGFYNASVTLTVTLHLDATTMLVPHTGKMAEARLVREDLPIEAMLVTAVRYRPDLQAVRTLYLASQANKGSTVWGGLGPQVVAQRTFYPAPPVGQLADTEYRQQIYAAERSGQCQNCRSQRGPSIGPSPRGGRHRAPGQHHRGKAYTDRNPGGCLCRRSASPDAGKSQERYRTDDRCAASRRHCRSGPASLCQRSGGLQPSSDQSSGRIRFN